MCFSRCLERQTPLIIGDFAITIGDVIPDLVETNTTEREVRENALHSKQWVVALRKLASLRGIFGIQATYSSDTKTVLAAASGKAILVSSSVSADQFPITSQRRYWLRIKPILPKSSPTRGTALYS